MRRVFEVAPSGASVADAAQPRAACHAAAIVKTRQPARTRVGKFILSASLSQRCEPGQELPPADCSSVRLLVVATERLNWHASRHL